MRIKVNSTELTKRLEQVTKVVASKNTLPILDDVMIETRKNVIVLTTSDSELWLSQKCPTVESEVGDRFCVNARDLLELIKNIDNIDIELTLDEESGSMKCDYTIGNFSMPFSAADEFPSPSQMQDNRTDIIIDGKKVLKALNLTVFAVGNSVVRPIMNGVNFNFNNAMSVSATNSFKIAMFNDKDVFVEIPEGAKGDFTMPKKACNVLLTILTANDGEIKLSFGESSISVNNSDFKLTARLIEGRFPDCKSLIPTQTNLTAHIDKLSLIQALKRTMPMANDLSNLVVMLFEKDGVTLTTDNVVFGKSANETVSCDCNSEMKIGFKCSDLIEILRNIDDDNVVIELVGKNRVGVFYASTSHSKDEYITLLAPSTIQ